MAAYPKTSRGINRYSKKLHTAAKIMSTNNSSNEDEEPKICTVFGASDLSGSSKTVFDTISFSISRKDPLSTSSSTIVKSNEGEEEVPTAAFSIFSSSEVQADDGDEVGMQDKENLELDEEPKVNVGDIDIYVEANQLAEKVEELKVVSQDVVEESGQGDLDVESPIPLANRLFTDAPEVDFPVGELTSQFEDTAGFFDQLKSAPAVSDLPKTATVPLVRLFSEVVGASSEIGGDPNPNLAVKQTVFAEPAPPPRRSPEINSIQRLDNLSNAIPSSFNDTAYSVIDAAYDAWIPKESTKSFLASVVPALQSGTYFPDKSNMTTPGIIYEDDLIDKVAVNMARIFGEAEASKRRILTADNVTQDDNGLRELIKLGCYRSAINLTKRLLTLYGQGPGKVGHFSKHNPHTLQLWFTRISLLVRIREFTIAESEIDAFKDFDNPDLYYEYYPDSYVKGRKGSLVPFNFRVLAAEIVQYSKKHNEALDRLSKILNVVHKIITNLEAGYDEDGSTKLEDEGRKLQSLEIWRKREIRVYYSLSNASLFAKDHQNSYKYLSILCQKDKDREPQLKSAIGRFFLQLGDASTAAKYFEEASELRQGDSDSAKVDNLVDSAMITIAHGSYPEAFALLKQALLIQPDNFMITNNMAVCQLYMGKVKESLSLMEATVKNNTPQLLQENVILNLSTIYELENTDGHKKNALLKLVSEYKGDGINLASLKMPNLI